mgnify:CR=1 FL=1
MLNWIKGWWGSGSPKKNPGIDYLSGPRMYFALREKLEQDGLGRSRQARSLEMSFLSNRKYLLSELGPLFVALDKKGIPRTSNPHFWWWYLDSERVVTIDKRRLEANL